MKRLMLFVFLVFIQIIAISTLVLADITWITNPANGHRYTIIDSIPDSYGTYYFNQYNAGWLDEHVAISLGGHLVSINDANENNWILENILKPSGKTSSRIGLLFECDPNLPYSYLWISGEALIFKNDWSYAYTPPLYVGSHWAGMKLNGEWEDDSIYFSSSIVEVAPVPEPSSIICLLGIAPFIILLARKKK